MATTLALTLPPNFAYVMIAATASALVSQWHGIRVTGFRKLAKVPYPNAYATQEQAEKSLEAYQFNCAQRAHANFLENYPEFLVLMATAGIKFPEWTAGLSAVYLVGRIMYATGYTRPIKDGGKGRYNGMLQYVGKIGLLGFSVASAYQMLI